MPQQQRHFKKETNQLCLFLGRHVPSSPSTIELHNLHDKWLFLCRVILSNNDTKPHNHLTTFMCHKKNFKKDTYMWVSGCVSCFLPNTYLLINLLITVNVKKNNVKYV